MTLLEAQKIQKRFAGVIALDQVNFSCEKGRITGLLGANGSGKSTLAKIITGVYRADAGTVLYRGKRVAFANPAESKRNGISMIFQNLSLVEDLTVWQNIVLGCEKKKKVLLDDAWARKKAEAILADLWPALDVNRFVFQLSPGEMQIVEIAKALISEPELLIMDEPTAALEREQVRSLFRYIRKLAENQTAIVFTSHRMKEVMELCDNVVVFKNGKNVGAVDFNTEAKDSGHIVEMIAGKSEPDIKEHERREISDQVLLSVKGLSYGHKVRDLTFNLYKGEVLGIGGLSGQGQEEMLLALAGNYPGVKLRSAELNGKRIQLNSPAHAIRQHIFLVPGDRNLEGLMLNHSVYHNLIYPQLPCKHARPIIPHRKYRQRCEEIVRLLDIKARNLDLPVLTLSGGNAQKVVIGKWLTFDTNVMLLSDPAKGVDVGAKAEMYRFLRRMAKNGDMGVVLYTSDTEELIEQCDRLLIMYEGRFVAELKGCDINEKAIYAATMQASAPQRSVGEEG